MILLCIDDDSDDRELLWEAIKTIDPNVIFYIAEDGRRGLELLNRSLQPDLIFLDMNMPMMDGKQTLKEIRRNHAFSQIPVCILSTTARYEKELLIGMGANFCIQKATSFKELCSALKSVLSVNYLI